VRIIVQKFGGTSVATPEAREQVAARVMEAVNKGFSPVVVVSAMGRKGDPYATDTLIQLVKGVNPETAPRDLDLLVSCGEVISSVVLANTLQNRALEAVTLTGGQAGIITDLNFTEATIIRVEPDQVMRHLQEGKVVVVAGFQGITESGDITTLGRGGSDTTAAALGAALKAEVVEIYTDVEGIKTADPRLVPNAQTLPMITYDEICQLAHQGAKVIHPRAVEIAMRRNVPIRIRCTFTDDPGTLIAHTVETQAGWANVANGRVVTGVTQIPGVAQVEVVSGTLPPDDPTELRIFRALADGGISVDMITVLPERKIFIVKEEVVGKAARILEPFNLKVRITSGCAKVSVVGSGMRGVPGVMARVVEALYRNGIRILQTTDSHTTISCLVKQEDMGEAVRALHEAFDLGGPREGLSS